MLARTGKRRRILCPQPRVQQCLKQRPRCSSSRPAVAQATRGEQQSRSLRERWLHPHAVASSFPRPFPTLQSNCFTVHRRNASYRAGGSGGGFKGRAPARAPASGARARAGATTDVDLGVEEASQNYRRVRLDTASLAKWRVVDLKAELKRQRLPLAGRKAELITRLVAAEAEAQRLAVAAAAVDQRMSGGARARGEVSSSASVGKVTTTFSELRAEPASNVAHPKTGSANSNPGSNSTAAAAAAAAPGDNNCMNSDNAAGGADGADGAAAAAAADAAVAANCNIGINGGKEEGEVITRNLGKIQLISRSLRNQLFPANYPEDLRENMSILTQDKVTAHLSTSGLFDKHVDDAKVPPVQLPPLIGGNLVSHQSKRPPPPPLK